MITRIRKFNRALAKIITLVVITPAVSSCVSTVVEEVELTGLPTQLPMTTIITKADGRKSWRLFQSQGIDTVMLYELDKLDAHKLLNAVEEANDFAQRFSAGQTCSGKKIRSGKLIRLSSHDQTITYEAVCENNQLWIDGFMSDEFVINATAHRISITDFDAFAHTVWEAIQ